MIGTLTSYDLIMARFQYPGETVANAGEASIAEQVGKILAAHNEMVATITADLAYWTNERFLFYGSGDYTRMIKTDEMGTAKPQKVQVSSIVGFPLENWEGAWQGSRTYFARATVAELMAQTTAMIDADKRVLIQGILNAVFNPTSYLFDDYLVDHLGASFQIPVKALVNGDGLPIPPGPNGEIFPSNHTHYMFSTGFSTSDMVALKENVLEHYANGDATIAIPRSLEGTVRTMTPNFVAILPTNIVGPITTAELPGEGLDLVNINNRLIGEFDGIPVWVKSWMPSGYAFCYIRNVNKVVAIRTDPRTEGAGDLALAFKDENHPLRAETYARQFGCGVWERTGGAVLMTNTGGGVYVAPTSILY
jgi:hypothetical protein